MAKRFFLFFVTIGLICSLAGLSACKSPSSPSGGNPQPVKYTVVYMNGEIKVEEQTYTANSVIDWSEIVNKLTVPAGKEFAYWCTDLAKPEETKISEGYKVTSNITLYAYFKGAATPEETYTVKFVNDDGSLVGEEFKDKKAGAEITVPEAPESVNNPDWEFSGWYLNGDSTKTPVSGKYTVKAEDAVDKVITFKAVFVDSSTAVPPESISLEPVSEAVEVGGTYNLADVKVTYSPKGTNTQKDITWSIKTGNEFATLEGTLVTAVKKGEVVLTATTANGKTAEFTLTVNDSLQSISVTAAPATVQVGKTSSLTVKAVYSSGEKELTAPDVEFTVNPADAGTISGAVFTAAKAGEAEITASYGEKTAEFTLTVTEEPVPDPVYTVKFVKDDGSTVVEAFTEKTAGTEITVPGETPVSTKGYDVFEGWYLNGDSTKTPVSGKYTVKAEDAQEGVITIKAVYKQTVHVEKIVSGTDTNGATWFWIGGVKVFAFVTGGSYGDGRWVPVTNHVTAEEGVDPTNYDAKVVLYPDWEKFYLVRANSETTEPDLSMLVDGAGKIYNKTDDVDNPKTEGSPVAISTPIKVFDFVSPGYLEVRIDHIKDSVGIQTGEEGNFMFYVAGSIGAESKDCWVKPVAVYDSVDGARFVLKVSDMNAGLGEGSSISLFILTELTNPSGESVWGNVAYQTDDMNYNPVESVYYPNQWKVHQ